MGWAECGIQDYQRGEPANWLERRMLEHANPVHFSLALAASLGFAYGLWTHRRGWIVGSSLLSLTGHAYCWTWDGRRNQERLEVPEERASLLETSRPMTPGRVEGMRER